MKPSDQRMFSSGSRRWIDAVILTLALGVAVVMTTIGLSFHPVLLAGICAGLFLLGMVASGQVDKQIKAGIRLDAAKGITVFTLGREKEIIALEPGKTWSQADHY